MRIGPIDPQYDLWNQYLRMVVPHDRTTEVLQAAALPNTIAPWGGVISDILVAFSSVAIVLAVLWLIWQAISGVVTAAWSGEAIARDWHSVWGPLRIVLGLTLIMPVANGNNLAQLAVIQVSSWSGQIANTVYIATLRAMSMPTTSARMIYTDAHLAQVVRGIALIDMCSRSVQWHREENDTRQRARNNAAHEHAAARAGTPPHGARGAARVSIVGSSVVVEGADPEACPRLSITFINEEVSHRPAGFNWIAERIGLRSDNYSSVRNIWRETLSQIVSDFNPVSSRLFAGTFPNRNGENLDSRFDIQGSLPEVYARWEQQSVQRIRETGERIAAVVREGWGAGNQDRQRQLERMGWLNAPALLWQRSGIMRDAWALTNRLPELSNINNFIQALDNQQRMAEYARAGNMITVLGVDLFASDRMAEVVTEGGQRTSVETGNMMPDFMRQISRDVGIIPTIDINRGSPIMQLTDWGHWMMELGTALWVTHVAGNVISSAADAVARVTRNIPGAGRLSERVVEGFGRVIGGFVAFLGLMGGVMILVGALHAYVLPALPMIIFVIFALGCLILLVEALIAAPIWALGHIKLSGQQMLDTTQLPGYQILFGLLIRIPVAMIAYVFSLLAADVSLFGVYQLIAPNFGGPVHSIGPIGLAAFLLVLGYVSWQVCIRAFSMINDLPDRVLRWIQIQSPAPTDDGQRGVTGIAVMGMQRAGGAATAVASSALAGGRGGPPGLPAAGGGVVRGIASKLPRR